MTSTSTRRLALALLLPLLVAGLSLVATPAEAAGLHLHRGSRGATVLTLETRLSKLGYLARSQVDRRYRIATVRGVKRWQKAHGLRATGTTNGRTWDSVATAYARATAPPAWRRPAWAPPSVTAHRGGSSEAPENTLAGLEHGVEAGAATVEFDLRSTQDGVVVLMHDDSLTRTTNCKGKLVSQVTFAYLRATCFVGSEPVPTFEEVATYLEQHPEVQLSPELKQHDAGLTDAAIQSVVTSLQTHGLSSRTLLQSFYPSTFPRVRALDPDVTFVYLSSTVLYVQQVRDAGASIASIAMGALGRANVETYHRYGIPVVTWTASTDAQLEQAWSLGVDSVGTDIPAAAVALYR